MTRHSASLRTSDLGHASEVMRRSGERFCGSRLALVKSDADRVLPSRAPEGACGAVEGARRWGWLQRVLGTIADAAWRGRSRRLPPLDLQSLSEHLRRDLGLTHHVEQPRLGRR
jgi:hypothetical protein